MCAEESSEARKDDLVDTESLSDWARVLPTRATESDERVTDHIHTVTHAEIFDRECHACIRDIKKRMHRADFCHATVFGRHL